MVQNNNQQTAHDDNMWQYQQSAQCDVLYTCEQLLYLLLGPEQQRPCGCASEQTWPRMAATPQPKQYQPLHYLKAGVLLSKSWKSMQQQTQRDAGQAPAPSKAADLELQLQPTPQKDGGQCCSPHLHTPLGWESCHHTPGNVCTAAAQPRACRQPWVPQLQSANTQHRETMMSVLLHEMHSTRSDLRSAASEVGSVGQNTR